MIARALPPIALAIGTVAIWLGASGFDRDDERSASGAVASPSAERGVPVPDRAVLSLRKTRYGKVIHEEKSGLVAYLFTKEQSKKPRCNGACAKAWPPIETRDSPRAGKGLKQKHLGTTKRRDGTRMVTYKGHPLYFYEHDSPGSVLCHDVFEFGGDWFVVKKSGKPA